MDESIHDFISALCYIFALIFQLRVMAFDSLYPKRIATATGTISITRNPNAPVLTPSATFYKKIESIYPFGVAVLTITATDADKVGFPCCPHL
jgi:hypothetical protein